MLSPQNGTCKGWKSIIANAWNVNTKQLERAFDACIENKISTERKHTETMARLCLILNLFAK